MHSTIAYIPQVIPAVIPLQRYYRRCITVTVVVPYTRYSVPSSRYYREILPIPTLNYRGYRGITAFPITVSFSNVYTIDVIIIQLVHDRQKKGKLTCNTFIHDRP